MRELRIGAGAGLTNPMVLCIGQLPEFTRAPAKVPPAFNVVNGATPPPRLITAQKAEPPTAVTLPAVMNGQMMPGVADRYQFAAKKGQHIVIAAAARELIPYISDAVPGWFQASITLRDAAGHEIASADHYQFHPDPVLYYEIPADGDYTLEIHDSIYRGREDFVYRITAGEVPLVTGIFPLGGKSGAKTKVELHGWNLPRSSLTEDGRGKQRRRIHGERAAVRRRHAAGTGIQRRLESSREGTEAEAAGNRERSHCARPASRTSSA